MPIAPIPVNLLVEDSLCESIARRLVATTNSRICVGVPFLAEGYGYIKNRLVDFNRAAKGVPIFALCDLVGECPVTQMREWLPYGCHQNLIFRVAIKESESWVLADRQGFARFLGISSDFIPRDVDNILDPKRCLVNLARKSRRRDLRESLIPKPSATAIVGPAYNAVLAEFVESIWNPHVASHNSPSLNRTIRAIQQFNPIVEIT